MGAVCSTTAFALVSATFFVPALLLLVLAGRFIAYVLSQALDYLFTKFHYNRFSSFGVKAGQIDRQTEIPSHL